MVEQSLSNRRAQKLAEKCERGSEFCNFCNRPSNRQAIAEHCKFARGVASFWGSCVLEDRPSNRRAMAKQSPRNRKLARNARGVIKFAYATIGQALAEQWLSNRRATGIWPKMRQGSLILAIIMCLGIGRAIAEQSRSNRQTVVQKPKFGQKCQRGR